MRGSDINFNPVFFAYLIVTKSELLLFVDDSKLPSNFQDHQVSNGIKIDIHPYGSIGEKLHEIVSFIFVHMQHTQHT